MSGRGVLQQLGGLRRWPASWDVESIGPSPDRFTTGVVGRGGPTPCGPDTGHTPGIPSNTANNLLPR